MADSRGSGFVHLNTPASITYTSGQKVSFSDLRRTKQRVECVVLPNGIAAWRRAARAYVKEEGFVPFAADAEDASAGNGPVLPPLNRGGTIGRSDPPTSGHSSFFLGRHTLAGNRAVPSDSQVASFSKPMPSSCATGSSHASSSSVAAAPPEGITIVSHHKVAGTTEFVYPDYDGVLTGGVVPEVVMTAAEKTEADFARQFYISPLGMTHEELNAFEELQSLWKSRARSHSQHGAQHRAIESGTLSQEEQSGHGPYDANSVAKRHRLERGDTSRASSSLPAQTLMEAEGPMTGDATDAMLEEALRLADELLRFS